MATTENKEANQVFYFNDEGQLVVETNKGVWVDGEKFVKMRGEFVCNAKTLGTIVGQLKGIKVELGEKQFVDAKDVERWGWGVSYKDEFVKTDTYCILGASQERIEKYEKEFAKSEYSKYSKKIEETNERCLKFYKAIEDYNKLPWLKRIFKKVEVK